VNPSEVTILIVMTLRVRMNFERIDEIKKLFSLYAGPVSVQSGCITVGLYSHYMHPEEYMLIEEWESRESLQKHIRSNDFQKILDIIDLAKEPPEIKFRTVSSIKGFELVKELRKNVKEEV
jgi:quinol monooxygenase YgiN